MDMGCSITRMETGMRANGGMVVLMGMECIITALERRTWGCTKRTNGVEEEGIFTRMELSMMGTGKMETRKEWGAISMEMEFIWENAI
jgi:hypothetical protein